VLLSAGRSHAWQAAWFTRHVVEFDNNMLQGLTQPIATPKALQCQARTALAEPVMGANMLECLASG
jgi:hypothetical protein